MVTAFLGQDGMIRVSFEQGLYDCLLSMLIDLTDKIIL